MSSKPPTARPIKGLKVPSDRKTYPPVVWALVFLLWFRVSLGVPLFALMWIMAPPSNPGVWIVFAFVLVVMLAVTGLLARMVFRGYLLAPYVLAALGVLGAVSTLPTTMVIVIGASADVLLAVFALCPPYRAYVRAMGLSRRPAPRLPYKYDGPQPNREDLTSGR